MCVLIVEGEEGLANLDQICAVPGVDVVYLGIYDISQSLGHPGDVHHPDVVRAIESCIGLLNKRGVAGGCLVQNRDDVRRALELGFRFLAYAADCALLYEQCRSVVGEFDRVRSQTPTEPVRHVALSDSHS